MYKKRYQIVLLFFLGVSVISAQQDSIPPGPGFDQDSSKQEKKEKNLTDEIYDLLYKSIFVDTTRKADNTYDDDFARNVDFFQPYSGRRIRHIRRKSVAIFGRSVFDTSQAYPSPLLNTVNSIHVSTRDHIIFNNLIFAEGDTVEPYRLADNGRILRKLPFLRDARIVVIPVPENDQEVDIMVLTRDVFSIGINGSVKSSDNFNIDIYDRNLIGLGWQLNNSLYYQAGRSPETGYDGTFRVNNLYGSFISGTLNYSNIFQQEAFFFNLDRAFLTPETEFAGGIRLGILKSYLEQGNMRETYFKVQIQDYWLGRSFLLGDLEDRRNFIISGRFFNEKYTTRPTVRPDSNFTFHNESLYLASLILNRVDYFKSTLILRFGQTEDIPFGFRLALTGGYNNAEFEERLYGGIRFDYGMSSDVLGYLSTRFHIGSFYDSRKFEDGVAKLSWIYFSHLFSLGNYHLRQFFRGSYTIGFNRLNDDQIAVEDIYGLGDISDQPLLGSHRVTINFETVAFSPWNLSGFRFAIAGLASFTWLGSSIQFPDIKEIYPSFGVNFRLRNENLVFDTIQLGFYFYPRMPDGSTGFGWEFSSSEASAFPGLEGQKPAIIQFN